MKVLNYGSLNLDNVYLVDHFVASGETLAAMSHRVNCGGKGLNQSIALARAGAQTYHAGCVGVGGDILKLELERNQIDTDNLVAVDALQGNAVIEVTQAGDNRILLSGGSNLCVTREMMLETMRHFSTGDYLVLQNEISGLQDLLELGIEHGLVVVWNPSPFPDTLKGLPLGGVRWILVNEIEAAQLAMVLVGEDARKTDLTNPDNAWQIIHRQFPCMNMVITLGSRGSVCYTAGGETVRQNAWQVQAVDTTAAGDTFTGYFVAGLMEGQSLPDCMMRGNAASALAVTKAGAASSIPLLSELLYFIEHQQ